MEDQKLAQLIADSTEKIQAEETERKAIAEAQEVEFNTLLTKMSAMRLAQVKGIPPALMPYIEPQWHPRYDLSADIAALKQGTYTNNFIIDAPGLACIGFAVAEEWDGTLPGNLTGQYLIEKIRVGNSTYYRWHEAITAAADLHRHNEDRRQHNQKIDQALHNAAMKEPSTADRLVELLGEIVADEIVKLLEPEGAF